MQTFWALRILNKRSLWLLVWDTMGLQDVFIPLVSFQGLLLDDGMRLAQKIGSVENKFGKRKKHTLLRSNAINFYLPSTLNFYVQLSCISMVRSRHLHTPCIGCDSGARNTSGRAPPNGFASLPLWHHQCFSQPLFVCHLFKRLNLKIMGPKNLCQKN